jgi:hypothetical protein
MTRMTWNQGRITQFAKRLNVVLRHAGWPECEYVGGPDLFVLNRPRSDVTIYQHSPDMGEWMLELRIMRSDMADQVLRVETRVTEKELIAELRPHIRVLNELIRKVRWALA